MSKVTFALFGASLALVGLLFAGLVSADPLIDPQKNTVRADQVEKTEAEWRTELTSEEYRILREKGTERAFTGKHWDDHAPGVYTCGGCGLPLFDAEHKFESGTGWPSYWQPIASDRVHTVADRSLGMMRVEAVCARCGGHLGHVFRDGPKPTGLRYCINGNVLDKVAASSD